MRGKHEDYTAVNTSWHAWYSLVVWVHSFVFQRLWMKTASQLRASSCLKGTFVRGVTGTFYPPRLTGD